ncbi:nitroreductase [Longilinea arvoryzae]|uniref:Nitroreductase n=1 Tax=Longilinea arvoryzae TaxID=360412 RepID=A0A0S7BJU9_9CHLR|nr:nitroreductase family protein [Longilinea arvoryzae]GAP14466.1 nitroreductase [Longilinea arvoryzae]
MDIPYEMIFKRKSFRRFDESLALSGEELQDIERQVARLIPLEDGIRVNYRIIPRKQTSSRRGEYCLLMYSEIKEHYLLNAGYLLEQMDLYLAAQDIGACWYGMGKPEVTHEAGLDFVIMLAFGKGRPEEFRKDYTRSRRKDLSVIWKGDSLMEIAEVARYAPSSCNSQPWRVYCDPHRIQVFRATGIRSIMPASRVPYYNSIDMGIFLFFLETCLAHTGHSFERTLFPDEGSRADPIPVASYLMPEG